MGGQKNGLQELRSEMENESFGQGSDRILTVRRIRPKSIWDKRVDKVKGLGKKRIGMIGKIFPLKFFSSIASDGNHPDVLLGKTTD